MSILNYTTKVDVYKTIGEIQSVLVKHGARKIMQDYDAAVKRKMEINKGRPWKHGKE